MPGKWTRFCPTRLRSLEAMARELHHILPQIDVTDYSSDVITDVHNSSINCYSPTPDRLNVPFFSTSFSLRDVVSASPTSSPTPTDSSSPSSSKTPGKAWCSGHYDFVAKIILLGDFGVGKSTLLNTLGSVKDLSWCRCRDFRANEYVELECLKNEKKVLIRIMDTGGQERFRSLTSSYFRGAHGCMLTFCVSNEDSFNNVINWFQDLNTYASSYDHLQVIPSVVVGTVSSSSSSPAQRRVSAERAFRLAESLNLTYCETHLRDEQMILFILRRLISNVILHHGERRPSLAVTIMPSLTESEDEKKRWKCCHKS